MGTYHSELMKVLNCSDPPKSFNEVAFLQRILAFSEHENVNLLDKRFCPKCKHAVVRWKALRTHRYCSNCGFHEVL